MGAPAVSVMRENSLPWWNRGYGVITKARHPPRVAGVARYAPTKKKLIICILTHFCLVSPLPLFHPRPSGARTLNPGPRALSARP